MKAKGTEMSGEGSFSMINNGTAIVRNKGYYSNVDLWRRGEVVYARIPRKGFVRLLPGGSTTAMDWNWDQLICPEVVFEDSCCLKIEIGVYYR